MRKTITRRKQKLHLIYIKGKKAYWYTLTPSKRLNRIYESTIYGKSVNGNFKVVTTINMFKLVSRDMK